MQQDALRAKVFISCGQRADSGERDIANRIAARLSDEGYDAYVALEQQNLRGVKENIFPELESSEYLLFIDFRREPLADSESEPPVCRGSLFSHQELAVAAFLDLEVIAFQEERVKRDDGLIGFLQANCIPFSDRHTLPSVVLDTVRTRGWRPDWKRQLKLERDESEFVDAWDLNREHLRRFFHVGVRNLDHRRHATNCYAYLESVIHLDTARELPLETIEFKWEGYKAPNATILPGASRNFDAIVAPHKDPAKPQFSLFTDSTRFVPPIAGPGSYRVSFLVISDNFAPTRGNFLLEVAHRLDDWKLKFYAP